MSQEKQYEKDEEAKAVLSQVDVLSTVNRLSSSLDSLDAKMELSLYCPQPELN